MNSNRQAIQMKRLSVLSLIASIAWVGAACGNADGNIYMPFDLNALSGTDRDTEFSPDSQSSGSPGNTDNGVSTDTHDDDSIADSAENCLSVPWGRSCNVGSQIYNLSFTGIDAATRRTMDTSFEALHCMGYNSAVIVAGDVQCSVCPSWYREVGTVIDDIHAANAVLIAISTANFGADDMSDMEAFGETEMMQPDYAIGSDPFKYPCRYGFTPYTMVVNLKTAEILDMDSTTHKVSVNMILSLIYEANQ